MVHPPSAPIPLDTAAGPELACNDNSGAALHSKISFKLGAGAVVVIVIDGGENSPQGNFRLSRRSATS